MKKIKLIVLLISFLFINVSAVNASTCDNSEIVELNKDSARIKVKYEEQIGVLDSEHYLCEPEGDCEEEYYYFSISILNMTPDFYIVATNNIDDTEKYFDYTDVKDGIISFKWEKLGKVATFTFEVYSSSETNCPNESQRKIYLTLPRLNKYYNNLACVNNPDYYLCQKYVTFDEISFYEFQEGITEYEEENQEKPTIDVSPSFPEKIFEFVKNNKYIFISAGALVIFVITFAAVMKRKRRSL